MLLTSSPLIDLAITKIATCQFLSFHFHAFCVHGVNVGEKNGNKQINRETFKTV